MREWTTIQQSSAVVCFSSSDDEIKGPFVASSIVSGQSPEQSPTTGSNKTPGQQQLRYKYTTQSCQNKIADRKRRIILTSDSRSARSAVWGSSGDFADARIGEIPTGADILRRYAHSPKRRQRTRQGSQWKMAEQILRLDEVQQRLPPPVPSTDLETQVANSDDLPVLVVLDDDPTGTQTCHGINVLTVWDEEILTREFQQCNRGFFILTNSRALPTPEARGLIREICTAVKHAAAKLQRAFEIVLRGDSTLRGHFPDEPEAAEDVIGAVDGWILAPFFRQGGRLTIDDVHYVADPEENLIPAAQTPFAKDATFGYANSNLRKYVVEKSGGSIAEDRVHSISLEDIRTGGPEAVSKKLLSLRKRSVIVVNAVVDTDMEVFVLGLLAGECIPSFRE
jgi:hypothetical protein